jgi:tRNA-dihydrouridine synthase A
VIALRGCWKESNAFPAVPGARAFRRCLAQNGVKPGAGVDVLREAMALVERQKPRPLAA